MSVRPECLAVESDRIFRPRLLLITNVREDHQEEMGSTKAEIAASLAAAIPEGGTVLVPGEEIYPVFRKAAAARKAELRPVAAVSESRDVGSLGGGDVLGFSENRRLALAAAEALGLDPVAASRGIAQARPDFGGLAVFRSASPVTGAVWFLVNAFAANEPESSARSLSLLERRFPALPKRRIALLALRADRGARTVQWIKAARSGFFSGFSALVFIGDHARAMARSRRRGFSGIETAALSERRPEEIMRRLGRIESGEAQIVGFGNIVGVGAALVEYWMKTGERAS
jgi:poly-gamma-glutamate synthase PgsB/CapB